MARNVMTILMAQNTKEAAFSPHGKRDLRTENDGGINTGTAIIGA